MNTIEFMGLRDGYGFELNMTGGCPSTRVPAGLLLGLVSSGLEYLLHLARHDLAADAALHGAAESGDLVGEGMARGDDDGSALDRQESRDGLLGVVAGAGVVLPPRDRAGRAVRRDEDVGKDVGRLALDEGLEPEEVLLHPGERRLRVVDQDLLEGGQIFLQPLGGLAGLAQVRCGISGTTASPIVGSDARETGGPVGLVAGQQHAPQLILDGLGGAACQRLEGGNLARAEIQGVAGLRARQAELAPFAALQRSVLFSFFGALAVALVISLLLARQITDPLRRPVGMTREVAEGRYSGEVDIRSKDEIGELAEAFRGMLSELREKQRLVEFLGSSGTNVRTQVIAPQVRSTATSAGDFAIGGVLAGRYEVRQQLGTGGMGVVYRAFDRELQEPVAIKTLRPELVGDENLLERFKQEIRLARRISHPNVVRTHDLGEAGGVYFITMEFVEGTGLDEVIKRRGALPLSVTLTIGRQLCRALEVAHAQGIVHRDIKPANLVVDAQGFLKVMDFGIARLVEGRQAPVGPGLTAAGSVIGTPEYMAPEQLLGHAVDGRADLYASGIVLFECATGKRLFSGDSFATVLMKQVQDPPPDPRTIVPGLPDTFVAIVLKVLAKEPEVRWQSAAELLHALESIRA